MPGPDGRQLDHDTLHQYLWRHSDIRGNIRIRTGKLGELLGIGAVRASRLMWEMELAGRIKKTSEGSKLRAGTWKIRDPQDWRWTDPAWALWNKWSR